MRSISLDGLKAMFAAHTGDVICEAITIIPPGAGDTVRLVKNTESIVYGGNTYDPFPLEMTLAPDIEDRIPVVRIKVDNIARDLIDEIRTWTESPDVDIEVFRIDSGGNIVQELGPESFSLRTVEYDAQMIQADLGFEHDILNEPATKDRFTPNVAPALF